MTAPASAEAGAGRPVREGVLAFGALGGFLAWAAQFGTRYALVPYVCGTTREALLHLVTAGGAAVALAAALVAWRARGRIRRVQARAPDHDRGEARARRADRQAFAATWGVLLSGFFFLVTLAEWIPMLVMGDPCQAIPTLERLIVWESGAGDPGTLVLASGLVPAALPDPTGPSRAWSAWNFDPLVLLLLGLATAVYLAGLGRLWRRAGRGRGIPRRRAACYVAGIAAIAVALVSPVDAVSEALFWVHMIQHLLLMVVAAPLLVLGRPALAAVWALPRTARARIAGLWARRRGPRTAWRALTHPVTVLVLHVAALWAWHVPVLYEAALADRWVHHLAHASFFLTALLFWWVVVHVGRGRLPGHGAAMAYVFATLLQGGLLGALITFAPRPWYAAHAPGTAAWGVDPLLDQQLAGTLMWVPTGLVYAAAALLLLVAWMRESDARAARREAYGGTRAPLAPSLGRASEGSAE